MKTRLTLLALAALMPLAYMQADDDFENKFSVHPTGRILMDGGLFISPDKEMFKDGVGIPDIRLGASATYGHWGAKVDVGFSNNKVGLKDVYFQYSFDHENFLRAGSFIHQFGLQAATSSSMKCTFEEPTSNAIFNNPRQIGLMYEHSSKRFLATASAHVEPQAVVLTPNQLNQQGYGLMSRLVWRPWTDTGKVAQIGFSGAFATPQKNPYDTGNTGSLPHDFFSFQADFPTRIDHVTALDANVSNSMNLWKFTPELLLSYGPLALESQYFYVQVNRRKDLTRFVGQGAYVTLRGLLLGQEYGYNYVDGGLATPKKGSLEMVVMYNYTSVSDPKAQIYGGRFNDISCTLNYYINKYMLARLRYSYSHRWDAEDLPRTDFSGFQARLQIIF